MMPAPNSCGFAAAAAATAATARLGLLITKDCKRACEQIEPMNGEEKGKIIGENILAYKIVSSLH